MIFAANQSINWGTGIPLHIKHIYRSIEKYKISKNHKLAIDAYLIEYFSKTLFLF